MRLQPRQESEPQVPPRALHPSLPSRGAPGLPGCPPGCVVLNFMFKMKSHNRQSSCLTSVDIVLQESPASVRAASGWAAWRHSVPWGGRALSTRLPVWLWRLPGPQAVVSRAASLCDSSVLPAVATAGPPEGEPGVLAPVSPCSVPGSCPRGGGSGEGESPIVLSSLGGAVGFLRAVRGPCSSGQGSVSSTGGPGEVLGREACCFTRAWGDTGLSQLPAAEPGKCSSGRAAAPSESAPGLQGRVAAEADGVGGPRQGPGAGGLPQGSPPQPDAAGSSGRPVWLRESRAGGSGSCTCQSCTEGLWAGGEVTAGAPGTGREGAGASQ